MCFLRVYPNSAYLNVLSVAAVLACVIVNDPLVTVETHTVAIVAAAVDVAGVSTGQVLIDTRSSVTVVVVALGVSVTVPVQAMWP